MNGAAFISWNTFFINIKNCLAHCVHLNSQNQAQDKLEGLLFPTDLWENTKETQAAYHY